MWVMLSLSWQICPLYAYTIFQFARYCTSPNIDKAFSILFFINPAMNQVSVILVYV